MKNLLDIFKSIAHAITVCSILTTLVLLPYPANFGNTFAQDTDTSSLEEMDKSDGEDCDEEEENKNADGTPGVYKPGCKFNKDLSKTDLKNHYSKGIKGIVEQFVGAAFAMIGVSLFFKPIPKDLKMCPQNNGAKITFPLVQAGSLAYLIGEISANLSFKKASKISVDKTFGPKQNEDTKDEAAKQTAQEANQKQLDAFENLAKIYKHQSSGLKKKVQMATLAELAFIGALGVEVANIMSMKGICASNGSAVGAEMAQIQAALQAHASSLSGIPGCQAAAAGIQAYATSLTARRAQRTGVVSGQVSADLADSEGDGASWTAQMVMATTTGAMNPIAQPGEAQTEVAQDNADGGANTAAQQAELAQDATQTQLIQGACGTCSACAPVMVTVTRSNTVRAMPINCCGVHSQTPPTDASAPGETQAALNAAEAMSDYVPFDSALPGRGNPTIPFGGSLYETNDSNFYVKAFIENLLHRVAQEKILKKNSKDPQEVIRQYAAMDQYIAYIMDNQDALIEDSNINKELEHIKNKFGEDSLESENFLLGKIDQLKNELTIQSANASAFKELLNIGVKATVLYFTLGKWLKEKALRRPKSRAYTWGAMAAVNAAIIMFNKKSLKDAKGRYETVLEEAEKFKNSHALKSEWDIQAELAELRKGELTVPSVSPTEGLVGGVKDVACAQPSGNTFLPAQCPSSFSDSELDIPKAPASTGITGGLTGSALGLISDTATQAAKTGLLGDDKKVRANLKSLEGMRGALTARNKKLIEDFDKQNEKEAKKLSPSLRASKLKSGLGRMIAAIQGKTNSTPLTLEDIKPTVAEEKKAEELEEKAKLPVASIPKFEIPNTNNGLNFNSGTSTSDDFNSGSNGANQQDLANFDLGENDINNDNTGNIFKIISNRYLRSYPVLLEEVEEKSGNQLVEP
ncbi:MAG: hypothetical protein CME62_17405 [Halobacteriovoraceae bacterium]|nr:hypothetical protein [Halobacteriovoraceae bacterium]